MMRTNLPGALRGGRMVKGQYLRRARHQFVVWRGPVVSLLIGPRYVRPQPGGGVVVVHAAD